MARQRSSTPGLLLVLVLALLPLLVSAYFQPSDHELAAIKAAEAQRLADLEFEKKTGYTKATIALVHGVVAWFAVGALIPLGMFASIWSQTDSNKLWLHMHWSIHVISTLLVLGSSIIAGIYLWNPNATSAHGALGFLSGATLLVQVLQGIILHFPIPLMVKAVIVGVHRIWALATFLFGSAAIISGLVLYPMYSKGEGLVAAIVVSCIQALWAAAVTGALLYMYYGKPEEIAHERLDGGENGGEGELKANVQPVWTPVDLDAPLTLSWPKSPSAHAPGEIEAQPIQNPLTTE